jgi:hypothetical protein
MGWEQRGSNQYFYRKEREGSQVKSAYVGRGELAHLVAQLQSSSPFLERAARSLKSPHSVEQEKLDAEMDRLADQIRLVTRAALLADGFHMHKRQWRKNRNGGTDNGYGLQP